MYKFMFYLIIVNKYYVTVTLGWHDSTTKTLASDGLSSAGNLCKQFGPRSGPTDCYQLVCHSDGVSEIFFFKKPIMKKVSKQQKYEKLNSM